jgi:hypothetical protein
MLQTITHIILCILTTETNTKIEYAAHFTIVYLYFT